MDMSKGKIDEATEINLLVNFFINEGKYAHTHVICLNKLYLKFVVFEVGKNM